MEDLKAKLIQKLQSPGYEDHKFSMSRRELIKMGLIAGGAVFTQYSFLQQAFAQTNAQVSIPFLTFDIAGGASMPGNFLVGQTGGPEDLCADYRQHGWNPRDSDSLYKNFGLPMSKKKSKMLAGLKETLPKEISENEAQTFLKMASFCHFSIDDTSTNHSSALSLVAKSGLRGRYIHSGIGTRTSLSGGNSDTLLADSQFKPKAVQGIDEFLNLTSFGREFESKTPGERKQIFDKLKTAAKDYPELTNAYQDLSQLGVRQPALDPRLNTQMAELYNLQPDASTGLELEAAIIYGTLKGFTGPSVLTLEDCDYHTQSEDKGAAKDLEFGQRLGRAIHAAYLLKTPLMFQIITDGGVYAKPSDDYNRAWVGDANQHSLSVIGYFNPKGNLSLRKQQVGRYTQEAQVDTTTSIGKGPEKMVSGVIANYLNISGQMSHIEALTGIRLQANEIDELLVFA